MRLEKFRLFNLRSTWVIPTCVLLETGTDLDSALGRGEFQPGGRRDLLVRSACQRWMLHSVSVGTTSVPLRFDGRRGRRHRQAQVSRQASVRVASDCQQKTRRAGRARRAGASRRRI